jgi:hypothetical protein
LCKEHRDEKRKMKSFKEGELVLWMLKATKIKGGKFTLPWKGPIKIQKMFNNNIVELSTISDEGEERVNNNKLKAYHHHNPSTSVIITIVTIDTRLNGKIRNRHRKKSKPNFPPNLYAKPKNLPWTAQNLKKHLMRMILSGLKKKIQEVAYQGCLKVED